MILTPGPLEWPAMDWVPAERDNFEVLRDCSNEAEVLADAVCDQLSRRLPGPLSRVRLLDYGAEPGGRLAALLRARVGCYIPVRLAGDTDAAHYLSSLPSHGQQRVCDAVLLCHMLPYVRRPDQVLAALARQAGPEAVAVAVGLA